MKNNYIQLGEDSDFSSYHPLVTFTYFCTVILISMFSMSPVFLAMSFSVGLAYSIVLGGWKAARFNLAFAVPILIITTVINPLSNHHGVTVLFYLNDNAITAEAILYGLASATMLVSVVMWFSCFNKIMTADKIIYLFGRVIPVVALLISMCFRFIPLLKSRFREIHEGQKCMGRKYPRRALVKKGRQLAKEISILIAWSLEAAIETSDSMEARGYGLHGRTSFHIFKSAKRDRYALIIIAVMALTVLAGCFLGVNSIYYYPAVVDPSPWALTLPFACVYLALLVLPLIIDIRGEKTWLKLNSAA